MQGNRGQDMSEAMKIQVESDLTLRAEVDRLQVSGVWFQFVALVFKAPNY